MRLLPSISAMALAFAASEVAAAKPFVKSALAAIPDDVRASNPVAAFGTTVAKAAGLIAAAGINVAFTGIVGAVAGEWVSLGLGDYMPTT